jgi:hypothetical protein
VVCKPKWWGCYLSQIFSIPYLSRLLRLCLQLWVMSRILMLKSTALKFNRLNVVLMSGHKAWRKTSNSPQLLTHLFTEVILARCSGSRSIWDLTNSLKNFVTVYMTGLGMLHCNFACANLTFVLLSVEALITMMLAVSQIGNKACDDVIWEYQIEEQDDAEASESGSQMWRHGGSCKPLTESVSSFVLFIWIHFFAMLFCVLLCYSSI